MTNATDTGRYQLPSTERQRVERPMILPAIRSVESNTYHVDTRRESPPYTSLFVYGVIDDAQTAKLNQDAVTAFVPWVRYVDTRLAQLDCERLFEPSPSMETLSEARAYIGGLLRMLPPDAPAPNVLPSRRGGVDFIWHKAGWNVEVNVDPDHRVTVWTRNKERGDGCHGDLDDNREFLLDVLRELSER